MIFADEISEIPVTVHNGFLIKHIMDDPEVKDGLVLIGTFIQHAFTGPHHHDTLSGSEDEDIMDMEPNMYSTDGAGRIHSVPKTVLASAQSTMTARRILNKNEIKSEIRFGYRFNDQTADERSGWVDWRRTEKHKTGDLGDCYRHTFQIKAPLELEVIFNAFPFKVVSATLMIEMSTYTIADSTTRLRPNLILHTKEKRVMCGIQKAYKKGPSMISRYSSTSMFAPSENKELFLQAKEKIDRSYVYDFASPFPTVTYYYDAKKEYCPKYSVSFLLVEDGMKKFVEIVFPMLLIAAMNHLNVANAIWAQWRAEEALESDPNAEVETVEAVSYLNNSATLALAVVVFLPTMFGRARFHEIFNANNMYVTTIFIALALSAIPYELVKTIWPARAGAWLFWVSFLFPVVNGVRFIFFVRSQRQKLRPDFFMEDAVSTNGEFRPFKPKKDRDILSDFIPIKGLVDLVKPAKPTNVPQDDVQDQGDKRKDNVVIEGENFIMEYKLEQPPNSKYIIVEYDNDSVLGGRMNSFN